MGRGRIVTGMLLLAVLATGCVVELDDGGLGADEPFEEGVPDVPEPAEGDTVPVDLVEGALGGAIVFVPVEIAGEGPFTFVLDTGASNTAIDRTLAEELDLEPTGVERDIGGVTGQGRGQAVSVDDWRLGEVELGSRDIVAIELAVGEGEVLEFDGLLGSDVLTEFGRITIDFDEGVLRLAER